LSGDTLSLIAIDEARTGLSPMDFAILEGCESLSDGGVSWSGVDKKVAGHKYNVNVNYKFILRIASYEYRPKIGSLPQN